MSETDIPAYATTLKNVQAAGHDEAWLKSKMDALKPVYGDGFLKDQAFAAWLAASQNGVAVEEIKVTGSGAGTRKNLADFTPEFARAEYGQEKDRQGLFDVEGVILNAKNGQTRKGGDKVTFDLIDPTGKVRMACYGEKPVGIFAEARVKDGDYVRIPQASVFGFETDEGDFIWSLTVPPFGAIHKLDKDADAVFKDVEMEAAGDGQPVRVTGIITSLSEQEHDACSKCGRWYKEDESDKHTACEGMEVVNQVSHSATLVSGTGQIVRVRFGHWLGKPKIRSKVDRVKVYGWWNKGNISVSRYVVQSGPQQQSLPVAAPAPTSVPASAPAASKPRLKKATPTTAAAPVAAPAVAPSPAPAAPEGDSSPETRSVVLAAIHRLSSDPKGAPWDEVVARAEKAKVTAAQVEQALNDLMDSGEVYEPILGRLKLSNPPAQPTTPAPAVAPVAAPAPTVSAPAASTAQQTVQVTAPTNGTLPTIPGVNPAILGRFKAMVEPLGKNRVLILVNNVVNEGLIPTPGGVAPDQAKMAQKQEAVNILARCVDAGFLAYVDATKKEVQLAPEE